MALFVLGDPHLSLGASKPMDIFPGWNDYVDRLEKNWRKLITPQDTIVLAGDISWAMRLTDTRKDFAFLQQLPGQKIIIDRKSTRLNSSHPPESRMPSSA